MGLSHFENEEFDEAILNFNKAIQYDPESSCHYNNRGLANFHYDRLEDAETDFIIAHQKDPNDPAILFNRGNVYLNWSADGGQRF